LCCARTSKVSKETPNVNSTLSTPRRRLDSLLSFRIATVIPRIIGSVHVMLNSTHTYTSNYVQAFVNQTLFFNSPATSHEHKNNARRQNELSHVQLVAQRTDGVVFATCETESTTSTQSSDHRKGFQNRNMLPRFSEPVETSSSLSRYQYRTTQKVKQNKHCAVNPRTTKKRSPGNAAP